MDGLIRRYFQNKHLCQDLKLYWARDGSTPITYLYQVVRARKFYSQSSDFAEETSNSEHSMKIISFLTNGLNTRNAFFLLKS